MPLAENCPIAFCTMYFPGELISIFSQNLIEIKKTRSLIINTFTSGASADLHSGEYQRMSLIFKSVDLE